MMYTTLPSLEGSTPPSNSSGKRKNAPNFPPPRQPLSTDERRESRSPPTRPLPAIPGQQSGGQGRPQGYQNQQRGPRENTAERYPQHQQQHQQRSSSDNSIPCPRKLQVQHPLGSHPPLTSQSPPQQNRGRNPFQRKTSGTPSPPSAPGGSNIAVPSFSVERPYYHGKVLPPIPQFDAITMSPPPATGRAGKSTRHSLVDGGEKVSVGMDVLASRDARGDDVRQDENIGESAKGDFGPSMRSRVHALMTEPLSIEGGARSSFDAQRERDSRPTLARVPSAISQPDGIQTSRFTEELVIDDEDIADFQRWKEMKRMDNQRYDATQATSSNDPRSPLELPSTPLGNITDSVPRRFLRKIASFGSRRGSQGEEEHGLWKRESSGSLLKKVTSLNCTSLPRDGSGEAPVLHPEHPGSNSASPPTQAPTTIDGPPVVKPQRPARSPLNIHVGRMEFEDGNPFAYVGHRRPMDAFRGLKRWSWYNKPGCRSFNVDPDWDNAKKELDRVDVADDKIRSIIANYEDIPEYIELIQKIENELTFRKAREDDRTSSLHMGIDLNNAPMVLRHLEEYSEDPINPMSEPRVLGSIGNRDEVDVPVMLEEDYSDDGVEGGGGRSFDCAAALNGQMTFLLSDSEDEGVEEEAVIGAYSTHRRYLSGEVMRVQDTDTVEGAFF